MKTPFLRMALTALAIAPAAVFAQGTFPDKPINYIIPFVPGGERRHRARLQDRSRQAHRQGFRGAEQGRGRRRAGLGAIEQPARRWLHPSSRNLPTSSRSPLKARCNKTDDIVNVFFFHYTHRMRWWSPPIRRTRLSPILQRPRLVRQTHHCWQRYQLSQPHGFPAPRSAGQTQDDLRCRSKGTGDLTTACSGKHVDAAMTYPDLLAVSNKERPALAA